MDSTENNKKSPIKQANIFAVLSKVTSAILSLPVRLGLPRIIEIFQSKKKRNLNQTNLDKKLVYSLSKSRVPNMRQLKYLKRFLSKKELWTLRISFIVLIFTLIAWGAYTYNTHLQVVPVDGGKYVEALVGYPKYINPLYANVNDVDSNIVALVYSSFFKHGPKGELVSDLAEDYYISDDNKVYTFTIKENVKWHNGSILSIDDIVFTFRAIQSPVYKSTLRLSFVGVEIEKIDERTVRFVLAEPYAAFLELLTFGIMPEELWYEIPPDTANLAELNLKPIGSGPYKFVSFAKDKSGSIRTYNLTRNDDYYGTKPHIDDISFNFYVNYEEAVAALNSKQIEGLSYLPRELKDDIQTKGAYTFHELTIPQLTAIFFNQDNNIALKDVKVRQALAYALNKNKLITDVLGGEAKPINSPILHSSFAYHDSIKKYNYNMPQAMELLEEAGWKSEEITEDSLAALEVKEDGVESEEDAKKREEMQSMGAGNWRIKDGKYLRVRLTTVDRGENALLLENIKSFWEEIGVKTDIEIVDAGSIQMNVIKPRNFEALFYGLVVGADPDVYVFWHSTQANENGLNISNFANSEVDQLLEDARLTSDQNVRREKYIEFQDILAEELPALFVYSPIYTYVLDNAVKGFNVETILIPRDRFANIEEWYLKTGKRLVWE